MFICSVTCQSFATVSLLAFSTLALISFGISKKAAVTFITVGGSTKKGSESLTSELTANAVRDSEKNDETLLLFQLLDFHRF